VWLPPGGSRVSGLSSTLRGLRVRPGFALAVILTLGLGIGAATTVWSFAYALLYRPYPYPAPDQLMRVQSVSMKDAGARRGMSLLDVEDYQRLATTMEGIGSYTVYDNRMLGDGPPTVVRVAHVTAGVLPVVGVQPVLGRVFTPDEDRVGGDVHKAVISHTMWQTLFSGDPDVIGQPLRTDRLTYTIVGVMPAGFGFPDRAGVWVPMESYYASLPDGDERREKRRGSRWYDTIVRLAPDVTLEAAAADLAGVATTLEREYPGDNDGITVALTPLRTFEMDAVRPYLLVCLTGVGLVLLICCTNVANLLIVRATERRRDVAIQVALGATWARITQGLAVESAVLGFAGAALGVALATAGVQALLALIPAPLPTWMTIEIDAPVLTAAVIVGLVSTVLFTIGPILANWRLDINRTLREGARGSTRSAVGTALVVVEIGLSVVLLVGAGLLVRTFFELQHRDPGFQSPGLVAARALLWAPGSRPEAASTLASTHQRVLDALHALPGVQSAGVTNSLPYGGTRTERVQADIFIEGRAAEETKTVVSIAGGDVSAGYFETMKIPLVAGRLFEPGDTATAPPVVVVSERAARMFWPDQDPIGRLMSWGAPTSTANPWTRVVGVVGDVTHYAAEGDTGIELYYPMAQWPATTSYYVVRTSLDPDAMLETVRQAIVTAEPSAAVTSVATMERTINASLWQRRLWGVLFTMFAALALVLAAVGIYGVISYAGAQRTRELGVRLALGARPADLQYLVVREGMRLCLAGTVAGVVLALAGGRVVASLLFEVTPYDGATYLAVLAVVGLAGLVACWIPAIRASRVDPTVALRSE
jgi:putative ABC transport system permease protein